jgi:rRNA maturation endonuclease Nob1
MNKLKVIVTPEHYLGLEEWYIPIIRCPKCGHKVPALYTKFCSGCGVELKLSTKVQEIAEKDN